MSSATIISIVFILFLIILIIKFASIFGNIIRFESFLLGVASGIVSYKFFHIHPAFCLLIGILTFIILYLLHRTKLGFWVTTSILSLFWAMLIGLIFSLFSEMDIIWFFVTASISFIVFILLHINARSEDEFLTDSNNDNFYEQYRDIPKFHFEDEEFSNKNKEDYESHSETNDSSESNFFKGVTNIEQLKKRYKDLLKIYHPDNQSGDTTVSQEIQIEYETLLKEYK